MDIIYLVFKGLFRNFLTINTQRIVRPRAVNQLPECLFIDAEIACLTAIPL